MSERKTSERSALHLVHFSYIYETTYTLLVKLMNINLENTIFIKIMKGAEEENG